MLGCFGAPIVSAKLTSAPTQPRADAAKVAPPLTSPLTPPSLGGRTPGGTPGGSSFGGLTFNLGGIKISQYNRYIWFFILTIPQFQFLYKRTKTNTKKIEIVSNIKIQYIQSDSQTSSSTMTSTTATATASIKTYRHEFSKEFMAELSRFSKVHQYDDRHAYKSEWQKWANKEDIAQAMEVEKRRLHENGYIGDIDDKMFKAGRYYFRKKTPVIVGGGGGDASTPISATDLPETPETPTATTPAAATERRSYITMSKQCIRLMDNHIHEAAAASAASASSSPFKPAICYNHFYETKMATDEMTKEIGNIIEKYEKTPGAMSNLTADELTEEIMDKIKKTYKNRYYKYISTTRNNNNNNI